MLVVSRHAVQCRCDHLTSGVVKASNGYNCMHKAPKPGILRFVYHSIFATDVQVLWALTW